MPVIDVQLHPFDRNHPGRPWAGPSHGLPSATGEELVAAMAGVGVDGAILVSSFIAYRYDPSYALEVYKKHPTRFGLIKPFNPQSPAVAEEIAAWAANKGVVGARIMLPRPESPEDPADPGLNKILSTAAKHSLPVNMLIWGRLEQTKALAQRNPDIFRRVMEVDMQVAFRLDRDVDQRVLGNLVEHVVQKADAGGNRVLPRAIQVHRYRNIGFVGLAGDFRGTHSTYPFGQAAF